MSFLSCNDPVGDIEPCTAPTFLLLGKYKTGHHYIEMDGHNVYYCEFDVPKHDLDNIKLQMLTKKQKEIYSKLPKAAKLMAFGREIKGLEALDKILRNHLKGDDFAIQYNTMNIVLNHKRLKGLSYNYNHWEGRQPKISVKISSYGMYPKIASLFIRQ